MPDNIMDKMKERRDALLALQNLVESDAAPNAMASAIRAAVLRLLQIEIDRT